MAPSNILAAILLPVLLIFSQAYFWASNKANQALSKWRVLVIIVCSALVIAAVGFLGAVPGIEDTVLWFIFMQIIYLGMGIFYYFLLKNEFLGELADPGISNILILITIIALGGVGFIKLFDFFDVHNLGYLYIRSVLFFVVPYFFMRMVDVYAAIPPEIYKVWYYDINAEDPDYDKYDLKNNIYLLELEFSKTPKKDVVTNFRAKAPVDIVFGEWYRSFINNYNYKFENEPIEYLDSNNSPYGWTFYTKPASWLDSKKFIDFEASIKDNKVNEKTVIVAKRVSVQE